MKLVIKIRRIYDSPEEPEGVRILVDKLWPRGIKKKDADIDSWWKDISPSTDLRKWFAHDPKKWEKFKEKYFEELQANHEKLLGKAKFPTGTKTITLLYSAKDPKHNNALA